MRRVILGLLLLVIIFSATSVFVPWWSINTSPEVSAILNSNMKTDYYLQQTVTATKTIGNLTEVQNTNLGNMTGNPETSGELSFWLSTVYIITICGLVLSCLVMLMIVLPRLYATFGRYATFLGYIAALLLLFAPVSLIVNFPSALSKLSRLTPVDIPSTWTPILPKDISNFWGTIKPTTTNNIPNWAVDANFWVWGADAGWYLTLIASLLMILASLLNNIMVKQKGLEERK